MSVATPGILVVGMASAVGTVAASSSASAAPGSTMVELNSVQGNNAFAQLRGAGYEQALLSAQKYSASLSTETLPSGSSASVNWTPLGPEPGANSYYGGNVSGRVTGLAVTSGGSPTVYAAAAGGGVWSTSNSGASWTTNTDSQPDIAMGSVAVDPSNSSYVFAGTGENNQCLDCFYGDGVLESVNGGASWVTSNPSGMFTGTNIASVVVEPGAGSLATTTVLVGDSSNLYVSTNGGSTWSAEAGTGWLGGDVTSIVLNSLTSPMTIYAWVQSVGLEESTNNGSNWSTVESGGSTAAGGSGALAIAPNALATSTILYDSVGSFGGYVGMYKSVNGGSTWTLLTNCTTLSTGCIPYFTGDAYGYNGLNNDTGGDQSWYDNVVAIDPTNSNIVVAGGITAIESTDGGTNWTSLNGGGFFDVTPKFHPDCHALVFDSSGDLYMGDDGGVWTMSAANVSSETLSFTNLNTNLDITQFYPGLSQSGNAGQILGGSQDNGSLLYSSTGSPATTWNSVGGGDGGGTAIDPTNTSIQIVEEDISSGGDLLGTTNDWSTSARLTTPSFGSANWDPPLAIVPSTSGPTVLFAGNGVFSSTDGGTTWSSPTGYTGSDVSAIAIAPSNSSVIYAGYDDGTVQVSVNGGTTWTTIESAGNDISHIAVSASTPYTAYVTVSNAYIGIVDGGGPHVLVGTALNTSPSWTDVTGNLPTGIPTTAVVPDGLGGLIAADDADVYWAKTLNGASTVWLRLGTGMPNVQVMDLVLTSGGTLMASTHGRGVWTIPFATGTNAGATVCTWNGGPGSSGSDWSVGSNWFNTSGASCTGAGGPPAGAQVVFPSSPVNPSVTWDTGIEGGGGGAPATSFDSITIQSSSYSFTNSNPSVAITLTPTIATPSCGTGTTIGLCAAFASGTVTVPLSVVLGESEEFASSLAAATLNLTGTVTSSSGTLTIGDSSNGGVVDLSGSSAGLTSATSVAFGTLDVTGSISLSAVTVQTGATLEGTGTIGSIVNDGGTVVPGATTPSPGALTSAGTVDLQASGSGDLGIDVTGSTAGSGYSQLVVGSGSINLHSATLSVSDTYAASVGTTFTIVSLTGAATATGTFNGLANGATFTAGGRTLQITYPSQHGGGASLGAVLTDLTGVTVPGAPTIGTATGGNASASVTWTAGTTGGSPITGYTVSADNTTTSTVTTDACPSSTTSTATSCTVSGLINGDVYTFTVAAINAIGTGPFSGASNAVTPATALPPWR